MTWTTAEGKTLEYSEMDTEHIKNTIAMLIRKMPDHDQDEYVTAEHWSLLGCIRVAGRNWHNKKIAELTAELQKRNN